MKNMLIIESDETTSIIFKERLNFYNINYKIARNGVDAYKILYKTKKENQFKVIITNINLPDENVLDIIKFIKEKFTSKIVIYTSKDYRCYKDKFQYDYFYDKKIYSPIDVIDLIILEYL